MNEGQKVGPLSVTLWERVNKNGPIPSLKPELGPCWEWTEGLTSAGYPAVHDPATKKQVRGNRAAWELIYGPVPDGLMVCHHCDNRKCLNPVHLFVDTAKGNYDDARKKGRMDNALAAIQKAHDEGRVEYCRGEAMPNAKLSNEQVLEMRHLYDHEKWGYKKLKKKFRVSAGTCKRIVKRQIWTHI